jgi:intracellular sulfur oxidation DsrE/DsrF family protein
MLARAFLIASLALSFSTRAADEAPANGKVVFDIVEGDGQKLLGRIETIDETRQSLVEQGLSPQFVLAFRGGATKLVQTDMEKVKPEDRPWAAKIAARLDQMSKIQGVSLQQCAVAIRHAGTKAENVLPVVKVIPNSYIAIMAYEAKGYAYIVP